MVKEDEEKLYMVSLIITGQETIHVFATSPKAAEEVAYDSSEAVRAMDKLMDLDVHVEEQT